MSELQHLHRACFGLSYETAFLVIRIPDARVLRIVFHSLLLTMAFVVLIFLGSVLKVSVVSGFDDATIASGPIDTKVLNLILHDLKEERLLKRDDKVLIMDPSHGLDMDFDESYDFVFAHSFEDAVLADRVLKIKGIVAFPLSIDPSKSNGGFIKRSNYKVVYLRRHGSIFFASRKIGSVNDMVGSSSKRELLQLKTQAKTSALKGLEDVLLEPPRKNFENSKKNLKIKYLPELMGDSLEGYKRRVFVSVGLREENRVAVEWFEHNYPKKSAKFQIHSLLVAPEDSILPRVDVSTWLPNHVKEEEYVVMKAEAGVVEDMMEKGKIHLVDELFLQCNNEWWHTGKRIKSGRAYWECLALYGRLRDEGLAVHQWWD
ncbi:hypothetical protein RJT34_04186 [Clitoria ternatea]|uniref:DUF7870 domain-containing protein n=1 Tax=Clitoria ternatea TaxID=43366 RepID=A0AAN9KKG1_CLITE